MKQLTILVVDDDKGCRVATARFLAFAGKHKVELAEDGMEGLKKAVRLLPDIILLDMIMPGITGLEVMDELCANPSTRMIPVIVITGGSLDDSARDSLNSRPNFKALREKPVNLNRLLEEIETGFRSSGLQIESGNTGAGSFEAI